MFTNSREELIEYERLISIRIIREDVESIYSLMQTERDPIFLMEIIPYFALFIQSFQEYMRENCLADSVSKELKDLRNHIKKYAERFGKSKKRVVSVDNEQDKDFKEQLKYELLKKMNVHFNLGTYWTDDRHVVGNTQKLADFFAIESVFDNKQKEKSYQLAFHISSFVSTIRDSLAVGLSDFIIERERQSISINFYYDINTNKKNNLLSKSQKKEISLFYLHLLCNMNFVKYILRPLFLDGNIWAFRVEYIVSYYTFRALERLKNYTENNNDIIVDTNAICDILKQGRLLFTTKLRNCLMHYNLENAGVISLKNIDKPFYGIIENCFEGKSYKEYLIELHEFSDILIDFLNKQFDFTDVKLKKL